MSELVNNSKNCAVLIVDDEPVYPFLLGKILSGAGYTCSGAENGRLGYESFLRHKPDLLITDLKMPEMNGLDLIAKIRETHPDSPKIIVFSGMAAELTEEDIKRYNISLILHKPLDDFFAITQFVEKVLTER